VLFHVRAAGGRRRRSPRAQDQRDRAVEDCSGAWSAPGAGFPLLDAAPAWPTRPAGSRWAPGPDWRRHSGTVRGPQNRLLHPGHGRRGDNAAGRLSLLGGRVVGQLDRRDRVRRVRGTPKADLLSVINGVKGLWSCSRREPARDHETGAGALPAQQGHCLPSAFGPTAPDAQLGRMDEGVFIVRRLRGAICY
jgi:hypothetical protein